MKNVMAVIFMILLVLLAKETQGAHVEEHSSFHFHKKLLPWNQEMQEKMMITMEAEEEIKFQMKRGGRRLAHAIKKDDDEKKKIPEVHEDYFGPRDHKAKHH